MGDDAKVAQRVGRWKTRPVATGARRASADVAASSGRNAGERLSAAQPWPADIVLFLKYHLQHVALFCTKLHTLVVNVEKLALLNWHVAEYNIGSSHCCYDA